MGRIKNLIALKKQKRVGYLSLFNYLCQMQKLIDNFNETKKIPQVDINVLISFFTALFSAFGWKRKQIEVNASLAKDVQELKQENELIKAEIVQLQMQVAFLVNQA